MTHRPRHPGVMSKTCLRHRPCPAISRAILVLVAGAAAFRSCVAQEPPRAIAPSDLRSGKEFVSPETRAQQDDLTVNPGMLWVEQGDKLWRDAGGRRGQVLRLLPRRAFEPQGRRDALSPLRRQARPPPEPRGAHPAVPRRAPAGRRRSPTRSQPLLALTALVAHQSRGLPMSVAIDGPARPFFDAGRALYHQRQGQLDLSCAQCHEQSWGKRLRAERISQGHANGFPIYRLEWQTLGSLHRRLRACFQGVRAEPYPSGAPELVGAGALPRLARAGPPDRDAGGAAVAARSAERIAPWPPRRRNAASPCRVTSSPPPRTRPPPSPETSRPRRAPRPAWRRAPP